jgi:hypothetical protein
MIALAAFLILRSGNRFRDLSWPDVGDSFPKIQRLSVEDTLLNWEEVDLPLV